MRQREEILNPLVSFQMAVTMGQSDRLSDIFQIIYSRRTMEALLDSLGVLPQNADRGTIDDLIEFTKKKIGVELKGGESFSISVADNDPVVAQRTVVMLAGIYIQTTLKAQMQENDDAVRFFEQKVEEYRKVWEGQQRELLSSQQGKLQTMPQGDMSLNTSLDRITEESSEVERILAQQERAKTLLQSYADNIDNPGTVSQIAAIDAQGGVMIYLNELKNLSLKYNSLLSRYTSRYPEVQTLRQQLTSLLNKSVEALKGEIEATKVRKRRLEKSKGEVLADMSSSLNLNELSAERRGNYVMSKEMYDNMRVKLEQAKVSRSLGERGASKYIILDPAQVPLKPTKPKKTPIIGGGIGLAFALGLAAAFLAEYLDPTIRRRTDIEVFRKPIVGYLP
jgi:uncharacterized protein involved in exopolysaccharide biosynthesis